MIKSEMVRSIHRIEVDLAAINNRFGDLVDALLSAITYTVISYIFI